MEDQEQNNPIQVEDTFSFSSENETYQNQDQDQDQESDFEFGSITPGSPTNDPNKGSPADLLFFNGRLLPHVFPPYSSTDSSTRTSRTSSISSKDSFMWASRSNSNNSRSSFSSTQTSPQSEFSDNSVLSDADSKTKPIGTMKNPTKKTVRVQPCSTIPRSRWQFIRPAPVLTSTTETTRRKKIESAAIQKSKLKKQLRKKRSTRVRSWFGWRIFRSIVLVCRTCHALEPSRK
ncbi:hypothetical protein BVC80_1183g59 [Macleaya cordata]|uniref:Uncharacterized protein n=1 Tax=Macleaya cordata TaxID=56857 RepID=A0A200PQ92_MACCD|nr:hypothetical protein BVC80_1183g59 [Macleaya cordata]